MTTRKLNLTRRIFLLCITFCIVLTIFPAAEIFSQNEAVTGHPYCEELAKTQGDNVYYKYDMTLQNNTNFKLKVDYQVIILAGEVEKKVYDHSTELRPGETRTETYYDAMSESDWELVTSCHADWQWTEI
jgi:hypothetical protein